MESRLRDALLQAESTLQAFIREPSTVATLAAISRDLARCLSSGHKALACGNGGSMCDAMHFAEEFSGRFRSDRRPYPVLALSDPAHMTCVANDYGYEQVFARQVEALAVPGDMVFLLSTSGNSPSIVAAAKAAMAKGANTVGLLGRSGGAVAPLCRTALVVPGQGSDRIQELHMLALHAIIEAVEAELGHE